MFINPSDYYKQVIYLEFLDRLYLQKKKKKLICFPNEIARSHEMSFEKEFSYKAFRRDSAKKLIFSGTTQNDITLTLLPGIACGFSVAFNYSYASICNSTKLIWSCLGYFLLLTNYFFLLGRPGVKGYNKERPE